MSVSSTVKEQIRNHHPVWTILENLSYCALVICLTAKNLDLSEVVEVSGVGALMVGGLVAKKKLLQE